MVQKHAPGNHSLFNNNLFFFLLTVNSDNLNLVMYLGVL